MFCVQSQNQPWARDSRFISWGFWFGAGCSYGTTPTPTQRPQFISYPTDVVYLPACCGTQCGYLLTI